MSKKEFIELLDNAKEDQYGNLYIEGEYNTRIYFGTIETVCEDLIEEYCCKEEDGYELYDRHFTSNDDTLVCKIVNRGRRIMRKFLTILCLLIILCGCREAEKASYNLRRDADYFNVYRRVTAINTWTDTPLFSVEGYISITVDDDGDLNVTIKTGHEEYKLFYAHLSANVTYTCEQVDSSHVTGYAYEITWFPSIENLMHGFVDGVTEDGHNGWGN